MYVCMYVCMCVCVCAKHYSYEMGIFDQSSKGKEGLRDCMERKKCKERHVLMHA